MDFFGNGHYHFLFKIKAGAKMEVAIMAGLLAKRNVDVKTCHKYNRKLRCQQN